MLCCPLVVTCVHAHVCLHWNHKHKHERSCKHGSAWNINKACKQKSGLTSPLMRLIKAADLINITTAYVTSQSAHAHCEAKATTHCSLAVSNYYNNAAAGAVRGTQRRGGQCCCLTALIKRQICLNRSFCWKRKKREVKPLFLTFWKCFWTVDSLWLPVERVSHIQRQHTMWKDGHVD